MGKAVMDKISEHKGFLQTIKALGNIFEQADRKALSKAFRDGDFKAVCAAMKVSRGELANILASGATEAGRLAEAKPEVAVEALKQHTANGSRP